MASKRNHTREIQNQLARDRNRVAVFTICGKDIPVRYDPRSTTDPSPWTDGTFRYNGGEIRTVLRCGRRLLRLSGGFTTCRKPHGHDKACVA